MTALSLQNIWRSYTQGGTTLEVLRGVNLQINAGEAVALVGQSGSGKTTLLQIAGLLDRPSAGEITIGQERMTLAKDSARTLARRKYLGFVYQFHHLLPEFSAVENIMLPQMIAGVSKEAACARAMELLAAMGLEERAPHRPAKLSGGEQQRCAIARAVANRPALLLADEPTGNLDPETAGEVLTFFLRLAREEHLAALVVTHNPQLASRMDRTVRLNGGRLE